MKKTLLTLLLLLSFNALAASTLYIGDSHSAGHFGSRLDLLIRMSGTSLATYAKGGSMVSSWLTGAPTEWRLVKRRAMGEIKYGPKHGNTPMLSYLLDYHKPKTIIVALGTNHSGQSSEQFKAELYQMLQLIQESGAQCFWVTPPAARNILSEVPRLKKAIREVVGNYCNTFQSDYVTAYPSVGGDGLHFGNYPGAKEMAHYWAYRVVLKLLNRGI